MMKLLVAVASVLQLVASFTNPAGVTYVNGPAPFGLAAGPASYSAPASYSTPARYTAPINYAAPVQQVYSGPPPPPAYAPYRTIQYAAPIPQPAYVAKVPAVADVPVAHYEAHPAVVQKHIDVVKPALKTRKYEIRRPAIQKQFYDIEERIIIRPAGSALVELDHPKSKQQKGVDVITPLHLHHSINQPLYTSVVNGPSVAPLYGDSPSSTPAPENNFHQSDQPESNDDSVVVDARNQRPEHDQAQHEQEGDNSHQQQHFNNDQQSTENDDRFRQQQDSHSQQPQQSQPDQQSYPENRSVQPQQHQYDDQQYQQESAGTRQSSGEDQHDQPEQHNEGPQRGDLKPVVESRSNGATPQVYSKGEIQTIQSRTLSSEDATLHQKRLIEFLTRGDGITEIGFGHDGHADSRAASDAIIRARVLSATPAPHNAEPTNERFNTRRIVVSRPIETIQEIEVVEPVTKLEKITVNQPTVIKTARYGYQRVATSVPVYVKPQAYANPNYTY